ncbi:hypothetical protein BDN71DRAFT_459851 [Pleurotus eryngii]|uniref:Uncharacterized protein n=1 Tax=Pleurotus eryngii TaxID=5323 RepID=A0A9P6DAA6_PLEER|nr:hypothetical protein BDN71DRAFT_459851 [Pleurotus eryngii]
MVERESSLLSCVVMLLRFWTHSARGSVWRLDRGASPWVAFTFSYKAMHVNQIPELLRYL